MAMLEDMHTWTLRQKMKSLSQMWIHLPPDEPYIPRPAAPAMTRSYDRVHTVASDFSGLQTFNDSLLPWRLLSRPLPRPLSTVGPRYIVHLYSGQRRDSDFHSWMLDYIEKQQILDVEVLSIDTAINAAMNVHDDKLWTFLLNLARQGQTPCSCAWTPL